jgi:hypothetical protein
MTLAILITAVALPLLFAHIRREYRVVQEQDRQGQIDEHNVYVMRYYAFKSQRPDYKEAGDDL